MWQSIIVSILIKAGTNFLLNVGEEVMKALRDRSDNDIGHNDVARIQKVKNDKLNREEGRDANY